MFRILVTRQSRYPVDTKALRDKAKKHLSGHGVVSAEVSIALVGRSKMRELSGKFMGEEKGMHEVLSFPAAESTGERFPEHPAGILQLGDIVVCYPEAQRIAIRRSRMMDDVIWELVEHGLSHLLGMHHE